MSETYILTSDQIARLGKVDGIEIELSKEQIQAIVDKLTEAKHPRWSYFERIFKETGWRKLPTAVTTQDYKNTRPTDRMLDLSGEDKEAIQKQALEDARPAQHNAAVEGAEVTENGGL